MLKRIITGAALVAVVTGFFFLRLITPALFEILIWLLAVLGSYEVASSFGDKIHPAQKWAAVIVSALFTPAHLFFGLVGAAAVAVFSLAVHLSLIVLLYGRAGPVGAGIAVAASFYPALLLVTMSAANFLNDYSTAALLMIFVISPFTDTFAYFVGSLIKGPKLCPAISPKKTVSGAIGGVLGGILGAVAVYFVYGSFGGSVPPWWFCLAVGAVGSVLTEFGDLVESAVKREVGVKDMGRLLPGHGGIMDRIDGISFACPFIYFGFVLLCAF
ncbi:MAG: phosphatidate cytidylyltransferase [Clostridia bacterium]|nr:phosphatidate cytidylyltransferase [Clostridia bacterium]